MYNSNDYGQVAGSSRRKDLEALIRELGKSTYCGVKLPQVSEYNLAKFAESIVRSAEWAAYNKGLGKRRLRHGAHSDEELERATRARKAERARLEEIFSRYKVPMPNSPF